jgi:hypothetical protein
LQTLGFSGPSSIRGNGLLHEFKRANQVFTLQLEKRGLPRFVVSLEVEPSGGFGSVVREGGTIVQGRLQPRRGASTSAWFRTDTSFIERLLGRKGTTPEAVVAECVALLPEVEVWWSTQAPSEHIQVLSQHFPSQPPTSA